MREPLAAEHQVILDEVVAAWKEEIPARAFALVLQGEQLLAFNAGVSQGGPILVIREALRAFEECGIIEMRNDAFFLKRV